MLAAVMTFDAGISPVTVWADQDDVTQEGNPGSADESGGIRGGADGSGSGGISGGDGGANGYDGSSDEPSGGGAGTEGTGSVGTEEPGTDGDGGTETGDPESGGTDSTGAGAGGSERTENKDPETGGSGESGVEGTGGTENGAEGTGSGIQQGNGVSGGSQDKAVTSRDEDEKECTCQVLCTIDTIDEDCPVCSAEDADLSECLGDYVMDENGLIYAGDMEEDAVAALIRSIDALPEVDSIYEDIPGDGDPEYAEWFAGMEQVLKDIQAAKEAYDALTGEDQEQIEGEHRDKLLDLCDLAERLKEMRPLADIANGISGTCKWVIDADGTLTISPASGSSGELASSVTWRDYKADVKKVIVGQGVKASNVMYLFSGLSNCTEMDVKNLDTSELGTLEYMFQGSGLVSLDLSGWNTGKASSMSGMFDSCKSLEEVNMGGLDTHNVTSMHGMFNGCSELSNVTLTGFDTGSVTTMYEMFNGCKKLEVLDISSFDTSRVEEMDSMFASCGSLKEIKWDVNKFNTNSATGMSNLFYGCSNLTSLDVTGFHTEKVTTMQGMFDGCENLKELTGMNFNTAKVTTMQGMFNGCKAITQLNVGSFNTSKVTAMGSMFCDCSSLTELKVDDFDTSQVSDMSGMFARCKGLKTLDISGFVFKGNEFSTMGMMPEISIGIKMDVCRNGGFNADHLYVYNKRSNDEFKQTDLTAETAKTNKVLVFKPYAITPTVTGNGTVSYAGKYGNRTVSDPIYKDYFEKTALFGGTGVYDPDQFYAQKGEDLKITYTPSSNYKVREVKVNGVSVDLSAHPSDYTIDNVTSDMTISVYFEAGPATVTFNSNGGSAVGNFTGVAGGKVTKPSDPAKNSYNFGGWYKESALRTPWDFENDTLDGNITLYAKWVENVPPTISVSTPPAGWQNRDVVLTLTYGDNVGVTKLCVRMDSDPYSDINDFGASPFGYTVSMEGEHTYTFKARDAAGNVSLETAPVTVKLDRTPPIINGAKISETGKENVKAAFTPNDRGTYHYMVKKSGESAPDAAAVIAANTADITAADQEITFTAEGLSPRTDYVLYLAVRDKAGNDSARTSLSFTTEKPDLEGAVTLDQTSPRYGDTLRASADLASVEPGTLTYEWERDGAKIAGVSGNAYRVAKEDAGKAIRVKVTAENYGSSIASDATGAVRKRQLTVTADAKDKEYDGKTEAVVDIRITEGKIEGDAVMFTAQGAFSDPGVGKGKTVTVSGITIDGADKDYYELKAQPDNPRADINKKKGPSAPHGQGVSESYPEAGDGKITGLKAETAYEISGDGSAWSDAPLTGTAIENLGAGTYWIREKETQTSLAGDSAQVEIGTIPPVKMATPQAVFEASDMTLSGVESGMRYSLDGGAVWTYIDDVTEIVLAEELVDADHGIQIIRDGNHTTWLDSDTQTITLTQAAVPSGIETEAETYLNTNDGIMKNVTEDMEYRRAEEGRWMDGAVRAATDLAPGTYYVRAKGRGTMLPSAAAECVVEKYVVKPMAGVRLEPSRTTLGIGGSIDLTVIFEPANATYKNVAWSSSNPAVVSVSDTGVVSALSAGTAVVTVTTEDGGKTADSQITVKASGGISGIVRENTSPIPGVTVEARQGGTEGSLVAKPVVTGDDGAYEFRSLPQGIYSLVAKRTPAGRKPQVITRIIEIGDTIVEGDIYMPDSDKNTVVEVKAGTPPVAADHLDDLYKTENIAVDNEAGITQADLEKLTGGGSLEIKLTAQEKEREDNSVKEEVSRIESGAGGSSQLMVLDLKVEKTVTESGHTTGTTTQLTSLPQLIKIVIPVEGLSDKVDIRVLRVHQGETQELPYENEYFEVYGDHLILYVKKFSIYGLAYNMADTTSGHTGGSGSGTDSGETRIGRWIQDSTGWWYEYVNHTWPFGGWYYLPWNDRWQWYHFNWEGYMNSGWYTDTDGKRYYLHPLPDGNQGYMYTGWNMIGGVWYYFEPQPGSGQGMLYVNRITPDGYEVDDEGAWAE